MGTTSHHLLSECSLCRRCWSQITKEYGEEGGSLETLRCRGDARTHV